MIGWWVTGGLLVGFFLGCAYMTWEQRSWGRKILADARREAEDLLRAPGFEGEVDDGCHPDYHRDGVHAPGLGGTPLVPGWPDGAPVVPILPKQRGPR